MSKIILITNFALNSSYIFFSETNGRKVPSLTIIENKLSIKNPVIILESILNIITFVWNPEKAVYLIQSLISTYEL